MKENTATNGTNNTNKNQFLTNLRVCHEWTRIGNLRLFVKICERNTVVVKQQDIILNIGVICVIRG